MLARNYQVELNDLLQFISDKVTFSNKYDSNLNNNSTRGDLLNGAVSNKTGLIILTFLDSCTCFTSCFSLLCDNSQLTSHHP